jgi:FKBP-type peptidyl-prolyl cis-trans isomerase FklB
MKLQFKVVFGIMLLVATVVAQERPQDQQQGTKGAAAPGSAASTKGTAPNTAGAKPKAQETPILTEQDKRGYALGVELGLDVAKQGAGVNQHLVIQGIRDALTSQKYLMTLDDMNAILTKMQQEQRDKIAIAAKEFAEKNKKDGEAFLAANKTKEGVIVLPSGLQYKILKAGDGNKPGLDDKVVCQYRGTLLDGTQVDSSYERKEPSTFPLKGVIKGWTEALQLMPVGSKWQLFVPSALAYGERGNGRSIGPNATLIFEVELLSIQAKSAEAGPQGAAAKPQGSM